MSSKKNRPQSRPQSEPKATPADADIVLRLYEQRREPELRKARNYVCFEFAPTTIDEFTSVSTNFGTPEQTYIRMAFSYWEQAAALVNRGAVHAGLFDDFGGELYFIYAKYKQFIPAVRRQMDNPNFLINIEKVAERSPQTRERVARMEKMIAERFRPRAARTGS